MRGFKVLGGAMALLIGTVAYAQPFPPQNPNGPRGAYEQTNYPYPGQCQADTNVLTTPVQWTATACTVGPTGSAKSFNCPVGFPGVSNFTAGGWRACDAVTGFKVLGLHTADPAEKFQQPFLNPFDYIPDTNKFPGADFYDIGLHEAWGYQNVSTALPGVLPNPLLLIPALPDTRSSYPPIPNGMQWTGIRCNTLGGCTCPAELTTAFANAYCAGDPALPGMIPVGSPLYTPIWGVGQRNGAGLAIGGAVGVTATPSPWSANNYVATWPSVSIRATKGIPVVVRWTNEFPNNHVFCAHPEAADWPCAIDRTFMGVKAAIDPAVAPTGFGYNPFTNTTTGVSPLKVNQFGGAQQPDNSWVTHLHGGDIPPATDGFAEKWYGNAVSGAIYSPTPWFLSPAFEGPIAPLFRPGLDPARNAKPAQAWNADTYTYPMQQEEALIWFHDHTLGKTHHNVIAGPAGFFPVRDPAKHGAVNAAGACTAPVGQDCEFTWLDPVTLPRAKAVPTLVEVPKYDLFMAIQDRDFNDDGSINFSNGLGNPVVVGAPPEATPVTPGANAMVHPVWIPEYFGNHILVNGIIWPNFAAERGWHRIRMANGSDSRCYTLGFSTTAPAPGTRPSNNVPFSVIANDQGYLVRPRAPSSSAVTFCPGERLELLINFAAYAPNTGIYMTNSAAAPFPGGETPFTPGGPFGDTNAIMKFTVVAATATTVPTCADGVLRNYDPAANFSGNSVQVGCIVPPNGTTVHNADPEIAAMRALAGAPVPPAVGQLAPVMCPAGTKGPNCISAVRQLYLNERVDGVTGAPLGMQINGVPFEYKVTETPRQGSIELWEIINLTVDAHPMHPHLVKHLRIGRQKVNVGAYKTALCGSATCQAGPSPGNEMPVIPDVRNLYAVAAPAVPTSALTGGFITEPVDSPMSSWKDASQILPGETLVIIAKWDGHYHTTLPTQIAVNPAAASTPGSAVGPADLDTACPGGANPSPGAACQAANWLYEPVTSGPFVWHCHINSHEDSEMMRTSLVIP
jgi:FtsP/CotA-like multicopper oxidase with cupredoxin domain